MAGGSLTRANTIVGCDKAVAMKTLGALVTKCYKIAGFTFGTGAESERNLIETVEILHSQLVRYFPNATPQMLETAFTNGANGFYGENRGMPVARFIDYLRQYCKGREGVNVQQPEEEPLALPRSERADRLNLLQTLYEQWRNGSAMFGPFGRLLSFVWENGKFLAAQEPETLERYKAKALERYRAEKIGRVVAQPSEFKTIRQELDGLTADSKDVKVLACKLMLCDFFNDCKEMDIEDLHDIFDEPQTQTQTQTQTRTEP